MAGNRTKKSTKSRSKVYRAAAKRVRARHKKALRKGTRGRGKKRA